ncbi:MAG: DUF134 domain-containing protein [Firmicutes bacterium]|nr:DUF134 domain-containing protein [Bacillota bacterium]
MARPTKWRKIENIPAVRYFIPSNKEIAGIGQNTLKLEELEAIRLKDLECLEQSMCADKMNISRPTFQRILLSARKKIADSLTSGKTIYIDGGNFTRNICPVKCISCGNEWLESLENLEAFNEENYVCPSCGSKTISCEQACSGKFGRGNCWQHGRKSR